MHVRIVDCRYRDLRPLADLFAATFPDMSDADIRYTLGHDEVRIALDGERIVGWTAVHTLGGDPAARWLNFIGVAPEARGRGLGARLLADVEREAMLRGVERIELAVAPRNAGAIRLYESEGYRPVERPGASLAYGKDVLPLGAPARASRPCPGVLRRIAARLVLWGSPTRAVVPSAG